MRLNHLHFVSRSAAIVSLVAALANSEQVSAQTWSGNSNVWDIPAAWVGLSPPSSNSATARIATGSGGSIRFTDTSGYTATVGTIDLRVTPSAYTQLNAGTASTQTATLNSGSGTSRFRYEFLTGTTGFFSSARTFTVGANRTSSRILTTNATGALTFEVRKGQVLRYFSTIDSGSGSVNLVTNGTSAYVADSYSALVLGAGDQASDGTADVGNKYTGGTHAGDSTFLILGESSKINGSGTITEGPVGTGTLTLESTGTLATVRVGAMRSGTITTGTAMTMHNNVNLIGNVQVVGGIDMTWTGDIDFDKGDDTTHSLSISPNVENVAGAVSTLTLTGTTSGASGLEKRGFGTLNLAGDSTMTGTISILNGTVLVSADGALGATGAGNETFVDVATSPNQVTNISLKFADGLNYTTPETLKIVGSGGTLSLGAVVGGTNSPATFAGTIDLVGNARVNSGPTTGGLTLTNAITTSATGSINFTKSGTGVLETKAVIVPNIWIDAGTLKTSYSGGTITGSNDGASVINAASITGGTSPTAKWDLRNNDLIIDYTGTSPMGTPATSGTTIAWWIKQGYNGGSWNGNGITTSDGSGTYALGYAEASAVGSTSFAGKTIDNTTVLVAFTYAGDANINGNVDLDDFTLLVAGFGVSNIWHGGDFNYDGAVTLDDFTIKAATFGLSPNLVARSTQHRLEPLYLALLDYPQIYWEARNDAETWAMFAQFDTMNLGPIPPLPEAMRNSIPEPTAAGAMISLFVLAGSINRRRIV